jgi:hypothetical protein
MQAVQSHRGIVNGHWEPTESHSKLFELVRAAVAKLAKRSTHEETQAQQDAQHRDQPIAAE